MVVEQAKEFLCNVVGSNFSVSLFVNRRPCALTNAVSRGGSRAQCAFDTGSIRVKMLSRGEVNNTARQKHFGAIEELLQCIGSGEEQMFPPIEGHAW